MITINLLPPDQRKGDFKLLPEILLIGGFAIVILLVVGGQVFLRTSIAAESKKISQIEEQIETLEPELQEVRELESEKALLDIKEGIINELIIKRLEWAPKLNQLAHIVPKRVWLEKIYMDREMVEIALPTPTPSKKKERSTFNPTKRYTIEYLVIQGATDDLGHTTAVVGEFMSNIENSEFFEHFENVKHDTSKLEEWDKKAKGSQEIWRFTLKLKIKGSAPEGIG